MERNIIKVLEEQHGLITRTQALTAGLTSDAIAHRLRCGRWDSPATTVYRLSGAPPSWEADVLTVVLAAGPDAAASHRSAAALLGLSGFGRHGQPEVTTPRARRHRHPPARVHRWRPFPEHHLTRIDGIPTTRVARTLVDLAGLLHPERFERVLDDCLAACTVTPAALEQILVEMGGRGRRGIALMRRLLGERLETGWVAPASALESRFVDVVTRAGLPQPRRQMELGDGDGWIGRVDFAYPNVDLVVELDGRRHHDTQQAIEADQRRDQRLTAAGWRVIRIRWKQLSERPDEVVALLRQLLARADTKPATNR